MLLQAIVAILAFFVASTIRSNTMPVLNRSITQQGTSELFGKDAKFRLAWALQFKNHKVSLLFRI